MRRHDPLTTENYNNRLDLQRTQPMRYRAEQDRLARLARQNTKPPQQGLSHLLMRLLRWVGKLLTSARALLIWNRIIDSSPEDDERETYIPNERIFTS